jgi:hypothetical protein
MRARLRSLPDDALQQIRLSSVEFKKARVEEHEIKVAGKMYDIARIEKIGDSFLVYCLHDEGEDNLISFLDKILKLPLKDKKVPVQVFQFSLLTFIVPVVQHIQPHMVCKQIAFTALQQTYHSFIPSIEAPPPKSFTTNS